MEYFLDTLTKYSNLILVIITGVYAYLTWKMVKEMKLARQSQLDSNVIAFPANIFRESKEQVYAVIHLENAGPGVALNVELSISFEPLHPKANLIFNCPALLVGENESFLFPYEDKNNNILSLKQFTENNDKLVIKLKWNNVLKHDKDFCSTYNIKELIQEESDASHIMKPKDLPSQMENISKSLHQIHNELANFSRNSDSSDYIEIINKTKSKAPRKKKVTK